jgi:hypothetical protein
MEAELEENEEMDREKQSLRICKYINNFILYICI